MAESDIMSVDTSIENPEDPLQDLTDEQIYELLVETLRSNEVLETETNMFDKYLKRIDIKDLQAPPQTSQSVGMSASGSHGSLSDLPGMSSSRVGRKRSRSRASNAERTLKLTYEQKCDIALRETEELKEEAQKLTDDSERVVDTHKAVMEEAEMRLAETKKSYYEFERDIVKGAVNRRSGKVVAEKVMRYFEEKIRGRETLIEKLRLKNSTLKVQKKKLHLQLKQKEELGEVLHEVDFNQLKIENQQYIEKIDERNQDLLKLKLMAGNTLQVLNSYKKKLNTLTVESQRLKSEITSRNEMLSRIDAETQAVENERAKAEKINRKLRQQLADYRVPDVMEYVNMKAEMYELEKKVKSWERKVEIADMALKINQNAWGQIRRTNSDGNMALRY